MNDNYMFQSNLQSDILNRNTYSIQPAPLEGNLEDWMNEPLESDVSNIYIYKYRQFMNVVSLIDRGLATQSFIM